MDETTEVVDAGPDVPIYDEMSREWQARTGAFAKFALDLEDQAADVDPAEDAEAEAVAEATAGEAP